jgi:purine-binding chemotaxis protein CheW
MSGEIEKRSSSSLVRQQRRRGDRDKNLVGFSVGDVQYAIEIHRVREIIRPLTIVTLPHAPPAIIGVADHRGEVVPILEVRRRFGLPPVGSTRRTKWILVTLATRTVGLVVDSVSDVFGVGDADRRPVPSVGIGDAARAITAVYGHLGTLVFVLDVDRIGAAAELVDVTPRSAEAVPPRGRTREGQP